MEPVRKDILHLKAAAAKHGVAGAGNGMIMNAAPPGVVALFQPNQHYKDDDAYLEALARALHHEYHAIVDAGITSSLSGAH